MSALEQWLAPRLREGGKGRDGDRGGPGSSTPLSKVLPHLSASSIGMLYRCPRQFRHRYLLGEKERPGENLVIGSAFHETLSWNYQQKIDSHTDEKLADAIDYLHEVAVPKVVEESGGADWIAWDTGSNLNAAASDAARITGAYYHLVVPRIQPVAAEQRFELQIPGVEVPVIGYIDVQEAERVVDTKTGKQATRKVKPSWQLQGRLYSFASGKPTEYHSISRAKTPTVVTALESDAMVVPVPTEAQAENTAHLVRTAAELIRHFLDIYGVDEEWPTWGAIPDWSRNVLPCDMCGWREGCPAWA